ncbi:MAG TPA: phosphoribosyltransferase family protein [Bacteroidales bacterium]|nr:phosphoribosyltransferase family protein [Bacteroidales bacterium]HOU82681.1 phosphoribosyltransferase family protein [Bacteroidales bacterium]HOV54596.1 phosphoribosyltransferase family protein [Bacteroidales bacterium]HRC79351.1 phosphoribosyltransferase family protein [Bacteroidales bacterium]HRS70058.1 phosphoribosyltransferase family protein [Bacteroidales bacterium]
MKTVQLHDKTFELFIPQEKIEKRIDVLSQMIIKDLGDTNPVFISVLNGAFMFTSEIVRRFPYNCEVDFLKISSYVGTTSSGNVNMTTNSIKASLTNRNIIVLEDIIDTGLTIKSLLNDLSKYDPKKIYIATLLFKPEVFKFKNEIDINYVGFDISNEFVVGYGLDYDGLGRNLLDIYKLNQI